MGDRVNIRPTFTAAAAAALSVAAVGAVAATDGAAFVQNGKAGFVVSHIEFALGQDAKENGACPAGMTQGIRPDDGQHEGETPEQAQKRFFATLIDPNRPNRCMNPEKFGPDPGFKTIKVPNVRAYGIDLDGQESHVDKKAAPGTCPHDDFIGMNGERGVDNQFYRVVGCSNSYQSTGQSNGFNIEMLTGSWGILITLSGVRDIRNSDDVEVGIYANADPIQLSPTREPLLYATYAIDQNARFQATTHGRIKDGVLTTDAVDVRFHKITNGIYLERPLKHARLKMTLSADGVLEGYLAGYTPVDELYDYQYAYRNGKNVTGAPAERKLIMVSGSGQAFVNGHTCNGAYYALHENADGDRDPKTGQCASISTQYRIKAIPAFVVDAKTRSVNSDLAGN
jgi:hypothetical protein